MNSKVRADIRWCSKVAEMKPMSTPGWGKFISEKNLAGKIIFELDFAGDPSISLMNSPYKIDRISPKIEGSPAKSSLKIIFPARFFSGKIFSGPGVLIGFFSATLEHQRMSVEKTAELSIHNPPPLWSCQITAFKSRILEICTLNFVSL